MRPKNHQVSSDTLLQSSHGILLSQARLLLHSHMKRWETGLFLGAAGGFFRFADVFGTSPVPSCRQFLSTVGLRPWTIRGARTSEQLQIGLQSNLRESMSCLTKSYTLLAGAEPDSFKRQEGPISKMPRREPFTSSATMSFANVLSVHDPSNTISVSSSTIFDEGFIHTILSIRLKSRSHPSQAHPI